MKRYFDEDDWITCVNTIRSKDRETGFRHNHTDEDKKDIY